MGGRNSKSSDTEDKETGIEVEEVAGWVELQLQYRYSRGLRGVLPALTDCIACLLAIQRAAIEVGGAVCVAISGERSSEGRRPGEALAPEGKDKQALEGLKAVVDASVQLVETVASRDWFTCPDLTSLSKGIASFKDTHLALKEHLRQLSNPKLPPMSPAFASSSARLRDAVADLPPLLDALELSAQNSRQYLSEITSVKTRVLGPLAEALSEARTARQSRGIRLRYTERQAAFGEAGAAAQAACEAEVLQKAKSLRARCAGLAQSMDVMLAPFVRIGQNVKGKSKIGRGDLTEEELRSIQKHVALLLKPDLYGSIEEGGGSIEDFLEALFLLGIAAGVGMSDANAKQSGLSRKSQAILADALDSFNADQLRTSYTQWKVMSDELRGIEATDEYVQRAEAADRAMAEYEEGARGLDEAAREWHGAVACYNRSVKHLCEYREGLVTRCWEEFGDAPDVCLPADEAPEEGGGG